MKVVGVGVLLGVVEKVGAVKKTILEVAFTTVGAEEGIVVVGSLAAYNAVGAVVGA